MRTNLNFILLIDDDEPTNFLNVMIIDEMNCTKKVVALESAQEGLDYLDDVKRSGKMLPDLIFLDINMPGLNGWEFLEEYGRQKGFNSGDPIIVMLTTSINPDDEQRANEIDAIDEYMTKPLTKEMIQQVIQRHFSLATN